ncbi:MAG: protein rep [Microcoleus sp.]
MKSDSPSGEDIAVSSIPQSEKEANNQAPALSDLSSQDRPWDKHKAFADTVESHYRGSEFNRYSERIHFCSELLSFGLKLQDDDTLKLKLNAARFCRVRQCPICSWRRSLKWKAKAYEVMPKIV